MRGIIFKTVKEGFRRLRKQHQSEVKRNKKNPNVPVVPYALKKADFKKKIRATKFTGQAEFKAQPGLKRKFIVSIEKGRRQKKKFRKPVIYGKAFASDRAAKRTLQIQPLTHQQRKLMKKEMNESAKRLYRKMFLSKKKKGGLQTIKMVKSKLEKASAAHAGQAKALGKLIPKKLLGGLLTVGIKGAAKKFFKSGGRKTQQIVKESGGTRAQAKADVKSAIRDNLKTSLNSNLIKSKKRMIIRDINKLR